jgi:hypothetical protein
MALQSHAVTLQSYAALAEIRDSLLETYASNDAMNQLILSHLHPRAWRAQSPGEKGNGRTIAAIFAHLHNSRLKWLKNSAPHLKCPPPLVGRIARTRIPRSATPSPAIRILRCLRPNLSEILHLIRATDP